MRNIIDSLVTLLWKIRFGFEEGAVNKQFWKEDKGLIHTAIYSPWNADNPENVFYDGIDRK